MGVVRFRRVLNTVRISGPRRTAALVLESVAPTAAQRLSPAKTVSPDALFTQLESILRAWGMPAEHAAITAGHMLYADLRGIDSHGCGMLFHYHRALVGGRLNVAPAIEVVRDGETTGLIDGGGGLGHVPGHTAMTLAIAKCRATGLGAVAVRNSGHFGAAGAYAAMAAEAGYLCLATSSADLPAIVPTRGKEAMLGTNPIAFTAPAARNQPLLLDMATSTVSLGKLVMAWRQGRPIPTGWALDETGAPVSGARGAFERRLLTPLGGSAQMGSHKGYGLAVMATRTGSTGSIGSVARSESSIVSRSLPVETLSSILSGMPAWQEAPYARWASVLARAQS